MRLGRPRLKMKSGASLGAVAVVFLFLTLSLSSIPSASPVYRPAMSRAAVSGVTASISYINVGQQPKGLIYDPITGLLYVTNYQSKNITVINPLTNRQVANIPTGLNAWLMSLDSLNGLIYISNDYSDNITVLDPATLTVIGNISLGANYAATGIIFDKYNGNMYALCDQTSSIVVINATYNVEEKTIQLPSGIGLNGYGVAITSNDTLYFVNYYSDTITLVSGTSNNVISTIVIGSQAYGSYLDPVNGMMYITLGGYVSSVEHSVIPLNPKTGQVGPALNDFAGPTEMAYDKPNNAMVVSNYASDNLGFISASSGLFLGNLTFAGANDNATFVMYSPAGSELYAALTYSGQVAAINVTSVPSTPASGGSLFPPGDAFLSILTGVSTALILVVAVGAIASAVVIYRHRKRK